MSKQTRKSSSTDIKDSLHSKVQQDFYAECTTSKERVRGRGVMELELHDSLSMKTLLLTEFLDLSVFLGSWNSCHSLWLVWNHLEIHYLLEIQFPSLISYLLRSGLTLAHSWDILLCMLSYDILLLLCGIIHSNFTSQVMV